MYEHYERHRTDNITDPAVRRSQPISTISGWDRERDDSIDTQINTTDPTAAITNGQINKTTTTISTSTTTINNEPQLKTRKISKSEQTDESTPIEIDGIKCACEDDEPTANTTSVQTDDIVETIAIGPVAFDNTTAATAATDPIETSPSIAAAAATATTVTSTKGVSSISNISQVYNEQISGNIVICNGNGHVSVSEDESSSSPQKESIASGNEALRQVLEIDTFEKEEESKEIVQELVEEILQKSESLLDDCQKTLERENILNETEASSPVIKDDEIELAVSEMVKGVLDLKKDANSNKQLATVSIENASVNIENNNADNDTQQQQHQLNAATHTDDNQKTDLVLSSAIISNNNLTTNEFDFDDGDDDDDDEDVITLNEDIVVKRDVNGAVNQSAIDAENCDKENRNTSKTGVSGKVTDVDDVELHIVDGRTGRPTRPPAEKLNSPTDINDDDNGKERTEVAVEKMTKNVSANDINETSTEEFVRSIVDEIVDKCVLRDVEQERNDNNINNNIEIDENTTAIETEQDFNSSTTNKSIENVTNDNIQIVSVPIESEESTKIITAKKGKAKDDEINKIDKPIESTNETGSSHGIKLGRSQSISTSTSTQVENNHFGKFAFSLIESIQIVVGNPMVFE